MKRWGLLVLFFYAVALVVASVPVALAAFWPEVSAQEALGIYRHVAYWVWLVLMVCGQLLLLLVPMRGAESKPRSRLPLLVPIIAASVFLLLLTLAGLSSVVLVFWGDTELLVSTYVALGAAPLLYWIVWAVLLYRGTSTASPDAIVKRLTSWLLRGSILELLVAISCHAVVRRKEMCCAPAITFMGIVTGLAVMLMSFGPGVVFLFRDRIKKLRPAPRADRDSSV